jgi:hypothetical protein
MEVVYGKERQDFYEQSKPNNFFRDREVGDFGLNAIGFSVEKYRLEDPREKS